MIEYQPLFSAVGAAGLYSLLWYGRQVVDPTKPSPDFDIIKLLSTVLVGGVIGAVSILSGIQLTQTSLENQLLSYGFLIAVVEQVGKSIYRALLVKFPSLQEQ